MDDYTRFAFSQSPDEFIQQRHYGAQQYIGEEGKGPIARTFMGPGTTEINSCYTSYFP
jgi:hypothetical protein